MLGKKVSVRNSHSESSGKENRGTPGCVSLAETTYQRHLLT